MKKTASYGDKSAIYYPFYNDGWAGLLLILIGVLLFDAIAVFASVCNLQSNAWTYLLPVAVTATAIGAFLSVIIYRNMSDEIILGKEGVEMQSKRKKDSFKACWDDVSEVEFCQDGWFGRSYFKLYLKSHGENTACHVIPVREVDPKILVDFIPHTLWRNSPATVRTTIR